MKNAYELVETILKFRPDKNIKLKSSDSFASIELYGISACKKVQDIRHERYAGSMSRSFYIGDGVPDFFAKFAYVGKEYRKFME